MTRTSSPILWYGDLVDFGTYSTAVSSLAQNEEITFSFVLDRIKVGSDVLWVDEEHYQSSESEYFGVEFDITIAKGEGEKSTVRRLQLRAGEPRVAFDLAIGYAQRIDELKVDGVDVIEAFISRRFSISAGSILPEMFLNVVDEARSGVVRRTRGEGEIARAVFEVVQPFFSKSFKEDKLQELCNFLISTRTLDAEKLRAVAGTTNNKQWNAFIHEVTQEDHPLFDKIRRLLAVAVFSDLLRRVDQQLRNILSGVLYIGPARARSERYYRYQDLSVSEIDPDGKNFPMFLNSLRDYQITRLSNWIESLFGYGVSIRREGGHISIDLTAKGNISNIVDTGYGVSQILPVLGQIWWARSRPATGAIRQAEVSLLAIEQPELHLHPAHQALLADALVGEVGLSPEYGRASDGRIHFLIETHSETLVNRLGELIHAGRLNHDDVQIIMFEPDPSGEHLTTTRTSSFNEAGELVDWPYGFFQPSII